MNVAVHHKSMMVCCHPKLSESDFGYYKYQEQIT